MGRRRRQSSVRGGSSRTRLLIGGLAAATVLGLQVAPDTLLGAGATTVLPGQISSSVSSVAAKAAYLRTRGRPVHQADPYLDSAPVRSPVTRSKAPKAFAAGSAASSTAIGGSWNPLGPQPISNFGTFGNVSGRVTSLAVDPTNPSIVYAGSAGGGVWKTIDGGTKWSPLTDTQATLSIGAVAIDPNDHLKVYAATGENDRCGDCGLSQGILKSIDGGATWTLLGQATFATSDTQASAIVVDRTNSNRVLVGTSTGLYISVDGGMSWTASDLNHLGSANSTTVPRMDVLLQEPVGRLWVTVAKRCQDKAYIAYSDNGGANWAVPFITPNPVARIGLGAGNDGTLYAAEASCPDANGNHYGDLVTIVKSTNAFNTFTTIAPPSLTNYFAAVPGAPGQGFYDNVVAVDRTNSSHVVFGGVTLLATKDGGATFTDVARPYSGGPIHPDFHAIAFTAALDTLYAGTDGGVYKTTDLGGTGATSDWTNLNGTLGITTFFSGTALDATHMMGGAQDNGTSGLVPGGPTPPAWKPLLNGDGTWTAMDPTPGSSVIYGEHPFGFIYKGVSTETIIDPRPPAGSGWVPAGPCWNATDPACKEPSGFVAPFLMDPTNPSHLWSATNKIYETTTGGTPAGAVGWHATGVSDMTTGTSVISIGDWISSMSYNTGFVATASFGGAVWVSNRRPTPGLDNWVNATGNLPTATATTLGNDAWVTDIWLGGTKPAGVVNASDMWVTMSGAGIGHVWHTTADPFGQGPWVDMSGSGATGLGNLVVDSITVTPSAVFIGTDAGAMVCFTCLDPTPSPAWYPLGSGLPNAKVDMLRLSQDGSFITAWTHGRGAWSLPVQPTATLNTTALGFGNQTVTETSAPLAVTVTSSGLANVAFTGFPHLTGPNAGDFVLQASFCNPFYPGLQYGHSCQLQVQFAPTSAGPKAASLVIPDNAPGGQQTIPLTGTGVLPTAAPDNASLDFGNVAVWTSSTMTAKLTNNGLGNLHVTGYTVTGANPGSFDGGFSCTGTAVPPGSSCTVSVRFVPSANGPATATFNILDNAADSPQHISLSANAVTPSVTVAPSSLSLSFGNQSISNPSAEQKVTLTNQGPGNLVLFYDGWSLSGSNPNDFVVTSNTCKAVFVAPGSSCAIGIEFDPMDIGSRTATMTIAGNAAGNQPIISLSGTGLGAKVSPSSALAFGENGVAWPAATRAITLTNVGNAAMSPLTVTVGGQNPSDFSAAGCGSQVMPGGTCTITVGFAPAAVGNRSASVQISGTAVVGLPQFVQVSGIGMLFRSVAGGAISTINAFRTQHPVPPSVSPRLGGPRPAAPAPRLSSQAAPLSAPKPASTASKAAVPAAVQATIPSIQELISRLIAAWLTLLP